MARLQNKIGQRGDTIVEVLIAIAIVGSVLGIAYSIMNRNLLLLRDNQERSEAVKQAQGQVEALKSLWGTTSGRAALSTAGDDGFCINASGGIVMLGGGAPNASSADDNAFADYFPELEATTPEASCRFNSLYHVGIRRQVVASNERYRVYVRWDKLRSSQNPEKNEVIITYRLY